MKWGRKGINCRMDSLIEEDRRNFPKTENEILGEQ